MLQVYTGEGRGKTSAALGLAVRALGAGLNVHLLQFIKGMEYSEISFIKKYELFPTEQLGISCLLGREPSKKDLSAAASGWLRAKQLMTSESVDLLILDELHMAIYLKLLDESEVIEDIKNRRSDIEIITTGRKAPSSLLEIADLVTEMKEIKHYYRQGILSRKGFDV